MYSLVISSFLALCNDEILNLHLLVRIEFAILTSLFQPDFLAIVNITKYKDIALEETGL